MRKIKMMLLSLALLAVVGGALAFKAKRIAQFCTTLANTTQIGGAWTCSNAAGIAFTCPNLIQNSTTATPGTERPYCTVTKPAEGCGVNPNCLRTTVTVIQDQN